MSFAGHAHDTQLRMNKIIQEDDFRFVYGGEICTIENVYKMLERLDGRLNELESEKLTANTSVELHGPKEGVYGTRSFARSTINGDGLSVSPDLDAIMVQKAGTYHISYGDHTEGKGYIALLINGKTEAIQRVESDGINNLNLKWEGSLRAGDQVICAVSSQSTKGGSYFQMFRIGSSKTDLSGLSIRIEGLKELKKKMLTEVIDTRTAESFMQELRGL